MHRLAQFLLIGGMVLCAGCDSEPEPEAVPAPTSASAPKPAAPSAAVQADPTTKMARAVGDGKPGAAVEIRYEIAAKPDVGTPTEVQIAFVPNVGVEALEATISGMDGVTIAGNLKPHFENVEAGKPYQHSFSLLPDRAGVYYITVSVTTTMSGASVGRTFSIPFVVGAPEAQQKAAPAKDASGQAVESMKAEESRE
jgi:hypothetical protein